MLILGLDTSGPQAVLLLARQEEILAERYLAVERTHMEKLLPGLDLMLRSAGVRIEQLEAVAVGLGPGSFTGTRLGVVVARTLAQTLDVPIVGVPSLDILAEGVQEADLVCVAVDARRNEVYAALYQRAGGIMRRVGDYRAVSPGNLAEELSRLDKNVTVAGDGLRAYGRVFEEKVGAHFHQVVATLWYPQASSLLRLALARLFAGDIDNLFQLVPLYVRSPDIRLEGRRLS